MTYLDPPTEPDYVSMEAGDEAVEKIARAFHDEYEAWAQASGWETQEATRTSFDDLPPANRQAMLLTVRSLLERGVVRASHPTPDGPASEGVTVQVDDARRAVAALTEVSEPPFSEDKRWAAMLRINVAIAASEENRARTALRLDREAPDGPASPVLGDEERSVVAGLESEIRVLKVGEAFGKVATSERDLERHKALEAEGRVEELEAELLTDDDRKSLRSSADELDELAGCHGFQARIDAAHSNAAFLRKLASQEEGRTDA